jgi:hypothetical protein
MSALRDRVLCIGAAAFAVTYIVQARSIEDSLLSDAVGAGGVPQGVGLAMLVAAVALFAKSWGAQGADAPARRVPTGPTARWAAAVRTAGLVLILLAYGVLLPWAGYVISIILLILACGWLAGAALRVPLLLSAALGGPLLWLLFDRLLQVRMPSGSLWG